MNLALFVREWVCDICGNVFTSKSVIRVGDATVCCDECKDAAKADMDDWDSYRQTVDEHWNNR